MQVFISYAREDWDTAHKVYESLRQYPDLSPWLDKKQLVGGTSWEDSITAAISSSDIVILLISAASVSKTTFIQKEVEIILAKATQNDGNVLLLPTRLDESVPPWPEIARLEMIDLWTGWEGGVHRLMAAIRSRTANVEARLRDAFPDRSHERRYRRALMLISSEEEIESWMDAFEDTIASLPSAVVFEHLNSIHPVYMDEIMDLALSMNAIRRRHPEAIPSYVFRIHEVAKKIVEPQEFPEAYGVALQAGRLLDGPVRTMFIRDMFDSFMGLARHHLFGLSTWPQEWTFCELAKHLLIQTKARYESTSEVVENVLTFVGNDVPALDLLVFAGKLAGDYGFLLSLLQKLGRSESIAIPLVTRELERAAAQNGLADVDLRRFDQLPRAGADLARRCRLGALLRAGEYLARAKHEALAKFGAEVMVVALEAIDDSDLSVTRKALGLSAEERQTLFDALETYQEETPTTLIGSESATLLKDYFTDYFYTYRFDEAWNVAPVMLDVSFPVTSRGAEVTESLEPASVDTHSYALERLLLRAAAANDLSKAELILKLGVNIDCTTDDGWTPLLEAAVHAPELTRILLSRGANKNMASTQGYTPLHRAAGKGNVAVVDLLLEAGADMTAQDEVGLTPYNMAIAKGQTDAADLIVRRSGKNSFQAAGNRVLLESTLRLLMMFAPESAKPFHLVHVDFEDGSELADAKVYARLWLELPSKWFGKKIKSLSINRDQS